MDFDWSSPKFSLEECPAQEIEEAFEDPFSIRLMPEDSHGRSRYVLLGKSVSGKGIFCVFRTDGKSFRIISAREMTEPEKLFYDRKNAEVAA